MKELISRVIDGVIALVATFLAIAFAPQIVSWLPKDYQSGVVTNTITLILNGLLLLAWFLIVGIEPIRRFFDKKAQYIGQYLTIHRDVSKGKIIGIFDLEYSRISKQYTIKGTTIDLEQDDAPIGSWTSVIMHFNIHARKISYIYEGTGDDSRNKSEHRAALGLAELVFANSSLEVGLGNFRDQASDAVLIEISVRRLTRKRIKKLLGRAASRVVSFDDMFTLAQSAWRLRHKSP